MLRAQKKVGVWPCTTKRAGFHVAPAHLPLQSTDKKRHLKNLLLPLTFGGGNAKLSASFPFGRAMP